MLAEALAMMPHRGPMQLLDRVDEATEAHIRCTARPHDGADYPLRLDGALFGATLVELGAQAAAAHASLYGIGAAHMGLVLSVSEVDIHRHEVAAGPPLVIRAERQARMAAAAAYRFEVAQGEDAIVTGDVLLSIREAGA